VNQARSSQASQPASQPTKSPAKSILKTPTSESQGGDKGALPLLGKNIVLPIQNPTGNPYSQANQAGKASYSESELKGLQVKAELNKLADPSPALATLLVLENGDQMEGVEDSRQGLGARFDKIQRARPAVSKLTLQLSRRVQQMQGVSASPNSGNQSN